MPSTIVRWLRPAVPIILTSGCAALVVAQWTLGPRSSSTPRLLVKALISYALLLTFWFFVRDDSRRQRVVKAVGISASVAFVCLLFEALALTRLLDFRDVLGTRTPMLYLDVRYDLEKELLFKHKPHEHLRGERRGGDLVHFGAPANRLYRWDIRYDEHGFRNKPGLERADVVLIGDSFCEGLLVADDEVISSVLARELGRTVANYSVSGYGPQQERAALRRYGLRLRPRVVVWMFFEGNDLRDVRDYESIQTSWEQDVAANDDRLRNRSFTINLLRKLDRLATTRPDTVSPEEFPRHAGAFMADDGAGGRVPTTLWFGHYPTPLATEDLAALHKAVEIIEDATQLCRAQDASLLLAFVPSKLRVYQQACTFAPDSPFATAALHDLPDRLRDQVHRRLPNLPFLDLTPVLTAAAGRGQVLYLHDDSHWSSAGHATAAQAIARFAAEFLPTSH